MKIDEARHVLREEADIAGGADAYVAAQVPTAAVLTVLATFDEIEYACANMNAGAPGWTLRNRILDILAGVRS